MARRVIRVAANLWEAQSAFAVSGLSDRKTLPRTFYDSNRQHEEAACNPQIANGYNG